MSWHFMAFDDSEHFFVRITFANLPYIRFYSLPACDILVQIQCGTGISILHVQTVFAFHDNFSFLLYHTAANPTSIFAKEGILLSTAFYSQRKDFFYTQIRMHLSLQARDHPRNRNIDWTETDWSLYCFLQPWPHQLSTKLSPIEKRRLFRNSSLFYIGQFYLFLLEQFTRRCFVVLIVFAF